MFAVAIASGQGNATIIHFAIARLLSSREEDIFHTLLGDSLYS